MRDGLGRIQSVAVIGGGSDIGLAALGHLALAGTLNRVVLAGRRPHRFIEAAVARGVSEDLVEVVEFDASDRSGHAKALESIFSGRDIDVAIVAFGSLMAEHGLDTDIETALEMIDVNYVGAVSALMRTGRALRDQGHGHLIVLSSIAGQRARPDNYLYGSSRAGIDFVARGMAESLTAAGVALTVVRPGFVHSKMTEGWKPAPFSVTADQVGRVIASEVHTPSSTIAWVPPAMRLIALVLKLLPARLLARLR